MVANWLYPIMVCCWFGPVFGRWSLRLLPVKAAHTASWPVGTWVTVTSSEAIALWSQYLAWLLSLAAWAAITYLVHDCALPGWAQGHSFVRFVERKETITLGRIKLTISCLIVIVIQARVAFLLLSILLLPLLLLCMLSWPPKVLRCISIGAHGPGTDDKKKMGRSISYLIAVPIHNL